MIPFVWKEGMTAEETKDGAYWERNMLALHCATLSNDSWANDTRRIECGWYKHTDEAYQGWSRVISLYNGQITFHIPDDFDLGNLKEIEPNWDGHSTAEKWGRVMEWSGVTVDEAQS